MPCLLMRRTCKICGKFHDFFFASGELFTAQRYEYHCPETGQLEYLGNITNVRAAATPPDNGVEIRLTGRPSERRTGA
jgi:hypothetical protein